MMYVTPTLLNSWIWCFSAPESFEVSAWAEFEQQLRKIPIQDNSNLRRGREFEQTIYDYLDGKWNDSKHEDYDAVVEIADIIRGGQRQVAVSKEITVLGIEILLYGKLDALKRIPYDIKRVGNYEYGKYKDTVQHILYPYCIDSDQLTYLIYDGETVHKETYFVKEFRPIESIVKDFITFLKSRKGYFELFETYWKRKY